MSLNPDQVATAAEASSDSADLFVQKPANRAVHQLQTEDSAALSYLARRGSEAERTSEEEFDDEAMANAEREMAEDAEWKRIQKNTFTRWTNEYLKQVNKSINDLKTDFSDGLKLIALIEVLSGKRLPRHNKKPNFRQVKNVQFCLKSRCKFSSVDLGAYIKFTYSIDAFQLSQQSDHKFGTNK